ncbi:MULTISPECIES: hypothetical protein [unclassified Rhizobium]|uniref:hypothetical protein n=1 Tax=unclassified Rhizobium TaxID=2613769 RepID=UPI0006FEED2D|nr:MULTISPECIES: hypothetical protein [unclassified Rhizobium]KQV42700.1 hypothetical protein ASC86_18730 [Rhizobium sp. Root1212]KRD36434.1 hypothetical protein ASE37_19725 [Rhizobium sp. Root268]
MTVAIYADYITELRAVFSELDRHPEDFQTFSVHLELIAAGGVVVYETKRSKGVTDSLYYGRAGEGHPHQQLSKATAFQAIDRFFALGQFLALAQLDESQSPVIDAKYPHCAVNFSYRKKGQPKARAMMMVFAGFNDDADAAGFLAALEGQSHLVTVRPYRASKFHEWK